MSDAVGPTVDAAQRVLAAEHAALYAYGVAGGVLDAGSSESTLAGAGYAAHRARRDRVEEAVRDLGADPVAAEPGYALPGPVTDAASATRLARQVEDRCAAAYAGLVAAATDELRGAAIGWLADAATRGLGWGADPSAFPGLRPDSR